MPEEILSNVDPSSSRSSNLGYNGILSSFRVQGFNGTASVEDGLFQPQKGIQLRLMCHHSHEREFPRIEVFHVHCCFFQSFGGLEPISLGNYNDREGILDTRPLGKQNFHREVLFGGSTLNKMVLFPGCVFHGLGS